MMEAGAEWGRERGWRQTKERQMETRTERGRDEDGNGKNKDGDPWTNTIWERERGRERGREQE